MNNYVTGNIIKNFREKRKLTQLQLAEKLNVSDKAVSKWEIGRGLPDITLLNPLAKALGLSLAELLAGKSIINANRCFNMKKSKFYVCPVCGNVIVATGEAVLSCCGVNLPALEPEEGDIDRNHICKLEEVEDEYYISIDHEMGKEHYISFIAAVTEDGYQLKKLYPEGSAAARLKRRSIRWIYYYCNRHGLFRVDVKRL